MMAQHVGRPFISQPAILLLFVHVFLAQLANNGNNVSATFGGIAKAINYKNWYDTSFGTPVSQPTVISARLITAPELYLLSVPVNIFVDDFLAVEFSGHELDHPDVSLRWSPWPRDECPRHSDNTLDLAWVSHTSNRGIFLFRTEPSVAVVYFCLKSDANEEWRNLGSHISIKIPIRSE